MNENKKDKLIVDTDTRFLCPYVGGECPFAEEIINYGMAETIYVIYKFKKGEIKKQLKKILKKMEEQSNK